MTPPKAQGACGVSRMQALIVAKANVPLGVMPLLETPIPMLAKVPIYGLKLHVGQSGLSLGDAVEVALDGENKISVSAIVRRRFLGVFPMARSSRLGHLGPVVDRILVPLLQDGRELRVRIVAISPEHLCGQNGPEVYVSVWGVPRKVWGKG